MLTLVLVAAFAQPRASAQVQQTADNFGTEFITAFLPNFGGGGVLEVQLTSVSPVTVTVEYPIGSVTNSVAVSPGDISIITIPGAAQSWTPDGIASNLVRLTAPDDFAVYTVNRLQETSDAALALPVDVLNTEYIVSTYSGSVIVAQDRGSFVVFAPFNDTTVTITPSNNMAGGRVAGTPFSILLNAGQGYLAQSATNGPNGSLAGTIVTASRPVGVVNGNVCTNIPPVVGFCDHVYEVAQPVQTWGNDFLAYELPFRPNGVIYRIVAATDGTNVTLNGAPVVTLNRGEVFETPELTDGQRFQANNPIFVTQYMTGSDSPGTGGIGDPAMGNVVPFAQYQNTYTFSTVGGGQFAQNVVTIIASDADVGVLTLDGVAIPAGDYEPLTTGFSVTLQAITEGTHNTASPNPHGITVQGYNTDDSYLYAGGGSFSFINPTNDLIPPAAAVTGTCDPLAGTASDADSGVFNVELQNPTNLQITVDPFIPGDSPVAFTVDRPDQTAQASGTVVVSDGSGNSVSTFLSINTDCVPVVDVGSGITQSDDNDDDDTQVDIVPVAVTDDGTLVVDGVVVTELPATGETPRWRTPLLVMLVLLPVSITASISTRLVKRRRRL
ncbi:MAG: IgGFc-binding protein [Chloroflexota bacterium]